jgi:hypothetical protein
VKGSTSLLALPNHLHSCAAYATCTKYVAQLAPKSQHHSQVHQRPQAALLERICTLEPRETAGPKNFDRLDFQTCWSLHLALARHLAGEGYAVGFELYDDIIHLDNPTAPTKVGFYQVKTKGKGKWRLEEILKPVPSIAGKLLANYLAFQSETATLAFVSNAGFSAVADDTVPSNFSTMDGRNVARFNAALSTEHSKYQPSYITLFEYVPAAIPLKGYELHITGCIVDFVKNTLGALEYDPHAFAATLISGYRRKSKPHDGAAEPTQVFHQKFLTRADVEGFLDVLRRKVTSRPRWSDAAAELHDLDFGRRMAIRQCWHQYEAHLLEVANVRANILRDRIRRCLQAHNPADHPHAVAFVDAIVTALGGLELPVGATDIYLTGAILFEMFSNENSGEI